MKLYLLKPVVLIFQCIHKTKMPTVVLFLILNLNKNKTKLCNLPYEAAHTFLSTEIISVACTLLQFPAGTTGSWFSHAFHLYHTNGG